MAMSASNSLPSEGPTPQSSRGTLSIILDWGERIVLVALYAWLTARIVATLFTGQGHAVNLLLLLSEGSVLVFVLFRRRATHLSRRPIDWLLAWSAMMIPLLVNPDSAHALVPTIVAAVPMLIGLAIQVDAKLVLGRSFGCVAANRGLKFSGPYRRVRHPIYLGYLLVHLGFFLMNATLWNLSVYLLCYCAQIPRLLVEERLLSQDQTYREYMRQVRFRLIPKVF